MGKSINGIIVRGKFYSARQSNLKTKIENIRSKPDCSKCGMKGLFKTKEYNCSCPCGFLDHNQIYSKNPNPTITNKINDEKNFINQRINGFIIDNKVYIPAITTKEYPECCKECDLSEEICNGCAPCDVFMNPFIDNFLLVLKLSQDLTDKL